MGMYLDPGKSAFGEILNGHYVDKTGLIGLMNQKLNTAESFVCISRPRRTGKSYAAKMLCAYYDCTCDSHEMFKNCFVSGLESYEVHINKYNVICLDLTGFYGKANAEELISDIVGSIESEILSAYPEVRKGISFVETLLSAVEITGRKFIMIIDEWDMPIRETPQFSSEYLSFIEKLFKRTEITQSVFAGVYMTGIFPVMCGVRKSDQCCFREYTFLDPQEFAPYTGFTEDEVKSLCDEYELDFAAVKNWYSGYSFAGVGTVYNPYSVMMAVDRKKCGPYWLRTSSPDSLASIIDIGTDTYEENPEDLGADILKLIAREQLEVSVSSFSSDIHTIRSRDEALTLLAYLGYLDYNEGTDHVRIPNKELRLDFQALLNGAYCSNLSEFIVSSERLLNETIDFNGDAVAKAVSNIQARYFVQQSLAYIIKFAYIICVDRYMKVEELPSGSGLADVVYLPKSDTALPALVVELKWDESADSAIDQIKRNDYPAVLADYCGEILLVGINYNSKTKEHTCRIKRIDK